MSSDSRPQQLAEHLTQEILRQRYVAGDRLPSERDLATRFDSSRGVVREALRHMANLGIIEVQPGGARVRAVNDATLDILGPLLDVSELPDPHLVEQLMDVVDALMRVAVRRTLERASDDQISHARTLIAGARDAGRDEMQRFNLRLELSRTFMQASGNLVLQLIANSLRLHFEPRFSGPGPSPDLTDGVYDELLDTFDASLAARDVQRASEAMEALHRLNRRAVMAALRDQPAATEPTPNHLPTERPVAALS